MMPTLPQTSTAPTPSLLAMLTSVQGGDAGEAGAFDQLVAAQTKAAVPIAPVADVVRLPAPAAVAAIAIVEAATTTAPIAGQMQAVQTSPTKSVSPPTSVRAELVEAPSFASTPQEENTALRQAQGERLLGMQRFVKEAMPTTPEVDADAESEAVELPDAHISDSVLEAKPEAPAPDKAIVAANELLATLAQFTAPAAKPAPAKLPTATAKGDGEAANAAEADVAAAPEAPVLLTLAPTLPTTVEARPTTKPAAETVQPRRDEAPTPQIAAPRVRDAATPLPVAAEPVAAKPAADTSMTVLFSLPAAAPAATPLGAPATVATIAERVLDLTSDDAWIDQLASDIAATKSASNEVSFRLMPRHLGRLDVSMLAGDDGVSLKLDTQHEATATIVTAAQVRLVDDLRQQGVRIADTQVTHTPTDAGRQSQQGQGRSPAQDAAHLIETATERDPRETRDQERAGDRRGRFA